MNYAGVELGGTKCVAILARGADDIVAREVVPTGAPEQTLSRLEACLRQWQERERFEALGIASFGPLDLDPSSPAYGHILTGPKPGWAGTDVARRLERATGVPTALDTDVNGAALAEMRWGAARGLDDVAYITVGTGVGVGLIVNGQPTRGFGHCELGHVRVARLAGDDWPGNCSFHGDCVEGLAAGPAVKARLATDQLDRVGQDDPVWESVAWALAQLCHIIVCAAAPRVIVIGGGVVERRPYQLRRIEEMLVASIAGYLRLPDDRPYVRAPGLGVDAGPLGAIALAMKARR
jgi:fructokinase